MAFTVPPRPVAHRSRWSAVLLVGATLLIAGVSVAGRVATDSGPSGTATSVPSPWSSPAGGPPINAGLAANPSGSASVGQRATGPAGPVPGTAAGAPASLPPVALPPVRSCDGGDTRWCRQLLRAAMAEFDREGGTAAAGSAVVYATVWHSLVCDVPLDCPRDRLARSVPVGSVVLEFADRGPRAWINIVGPPATRELDGQGLEAWIVRWG